jgi:hypothetical protein
VALRAPRRCAAATPTGPDSGDRPKLAGRARHGQLGAHNRTWRTPGMTRREQRATRRRLRTGPDSPIGRRMTIWLMRLPPSSSPPRPRRRDPRHVDRYQRVRDASPRLSSSRRNPTCDGCGRRGDNAGEHRWSRAAVSADHGRGTRGSSCSGPIAAGPVVSVPQTRSVSHPSTGWRHNWSRSMRARAGDRLPASSRSPTMPGGAASPPEKTSRGLLQRFRPRISWARGTRTPPPSPVLVRVPSSEAEW